MGEEIVISVNNISKCYKRYNRPVDRLKELLLPGKNISNEFWALQNINLEIIKGQTVGILGQNGSGKSTLLQIIAGTLTPTTGEIKVNGRLSALLELGSGFNPEFTGEQNVFFNGRLLGLSKEEIEEKFDDIAAFADIGDFLYQPVKTYSSGMYVRLAFSVAINVNPSILIVDEALAVGDARFQQRCMTRINQLRSNGVSVLFVSHDSQAIKRLCDYAVVIEKGQMVNHGLAVDMVSWYLALMTVDFNMQKLHEIEELARMPNKITNDNFEQIALANCVEKNSIVEVSDLENLNKIVESQVETRSIQEETNTAKTQFSSYREFRYFRHGDGQARIIRTWIENDQNQEVDFVYLEQMITVYVETEFFTNLSRYLIGILVRDRLGTDIIGINTYQENIEIPEVSKGDKFIYSFRFAINIKPGVYSISSSVAYDQYSMPWMDWVENAFILRVMDLEPKRLVFGVYHPPQRYIHIKKLNA